MTRSEFATAFAVPRETIDKFDRYLVLLAEAQAQTNLVGGSTLPLAWERHFADSAQLLTCAPAHTRWIDLGAGAGFPGLVLAILGASVELVEATAKKAAFLEHVVAELAIGASTRVHHARVESMPAAPRDVITARAFAPLARLFDWGARFASNATLWVLPKGIRVEEEMAVARATFRFDAELRPSRTSETGRILLARNVERRR